MMSTEAKKKKNAAGGSCQRNQSLDKLKGMIQMQKTQTGGFSLVKVGGEEAEISVFR